MAGAQTYTLGTMTPYDPNRGLPYGTEAVQAMRSVTLDTYFTDTVGATISRVIMCTVDGFVTLEWIDGTSTTVPIISGVLYPYRASRVLTSGTTATGLFWGY